MRLPPALLAVVLFAAGCSSLDYDLARLSFPVRATPATPQERTSEPFTATAKSVLWVHGLFGRSGPDVAGLLQEAASDSAGVVEFRAGASASFHDWLITHLTLGFVRIKTVTISGRKLMR